MKGTLKSYVSLFDGSIDAVQIPRIQRDYAQGRRAADVDEIRSNFLDVLLEAIGGGEPVGLDFVYGRIEGSTLRPLDGQQRLTTLFLIHWYFASAAGRLEAAAPWTRFTYATRPGAGMFCRRLTEHPLPADVDVPSAWIIDQPWYLYLWRHDPTVEAMLVVIDAIHERVRGRTGLTPQAAWERLVRAQAPAVSFYLLPLSDMDSDEELYITMNSRGKPLTEFESFKARFEQDIAHSPLAGPIARKIDREWSDLLWPYRGADNIVDDEFVRYFGFITEICELREGRLASGPLGARARAVFGAGNMRADEHLQFLQKAFDVWGDVGAAFQDLSIIGPGKEGYDWRKIVLHGAAATNLFEQCCHQFEINRGEGRAFTLRQSLLLYAFLLHRISGTPEFPRRLRVLRNLLAASSDNEIRRPNMPELLRDVDAVIVGDDLSAVRKFSSNQVADEQRKREFLQTRPELADALFRLEDHSFLRGTLSCFELDAATLRDRAAAFEALFADAGIWSGLTGALLATGDYQRQPPRWTAWQFGTSSPGHEGVWRDLLTGASWDGLRATRAVLGDFLDGFAREGTTPAGYAKSVIGRYLARCEESERFDWRYLLVKYPQMREGATGIYHGVDGKLGYCMCMMRTRQLNGYYRDPVLYAMWRTSGVGEAVRDPWFTGYTTTPRWLRLERSGVRVRNVPDGFELRGPEDEAFRPLFDRVCNRDSAMRVSQRRTLLRVRQRVVEEGRVDTADRVKVGASLLRRLVKAGL